MGGSDMMESAAMAKCTIFGPFTFNFKQTVQALLQAQGAIEVENEKELRFAVQKCLDEPLFAQKIAKNGQNVIKENQGATQKSVDAIVGLVVSD
jgi:3-deoxy-D-manno-octulosonic-acid transferase